MSELTRSHGGPVCLVAYKRVEYMPKLIGKLEKDIIDGHLATHLGLHNDSLRFGMLVNSPRCTSCNKRRKMAAGLACARTT